MANTASMIPMPGRFNEPQSLRQLTRGRGFAAELTGFLIPFARQDYIYQEFDFQETAITDNPNAMWAVDNSGGAGAASFATVANAEEGTIQGDTGTTDNGGVSIVYDMISSNADKNPGMHVYMKIDDVSEAGLEIGYSDAKTDENTLAVTDTDTAALANGVTDGAFIAYDTDGTENGMVLVAGGATDTDTLAAIGDSTAASPITDTVFFNARLQVYANAAYANMDAGSNTAPDAILDAGLSVGPDADVLMRPSIVCVTRNTTAKFPVIDLIRIWRNRYA